MQFWPPDEEHMRSKHVEAWNKLIVKQKYCASSWLITEINILRCTVSKTSKLHQLYTFKNATSSQIVTFSAIVVRLYTGWLHGRSPVRSRCRNFIYIGFFILKPHKEYFSSQSQPQLRHLSHHGTGFSNPCWFEYQSASCVISHHVTAVSTVPSSSNLSCRKYMLGAASTDGKLNSKIQFLHANSYKLSIYLTGFFQM